MKILTNKKLLTSCLEFGKVIPIHLQGNFTNKCNYDCGFCSCGSRDKTIEMSLHKIVDFMMIFKDLGGESVTITGGGDPFCHRSIKNIINEISDLGIKIGIVSNGSLWNRVQGCRKFGEITWIRVSSSDELNMQLFRISRNLGWWLWRLQLMVKEYPQIDWAFSHVVSKDPPDFNLIGQLVDFANTHQFTHVRLVSDILKAEKISPVMQQIREYLNAQEIDDGIVNYQDRATWTRGSNPCYISLLKPVLAADGYLHPCCGVQYALPEPSRDYEKAMRMGYMDDFREIINRQQFFNGEVCVKCYYSDYNRALAAMLNGIRHKEFI